MRMLSSSSCTHWRAKPRKEWTLAELVVQCLVAGPTSQKTRQRPTNRRSGSMLNFSRVVLASPQQQHTGSIHFNIFRTLLFSIKKMVQQRERTFYRVDPQGNTFNLQHVAVPLADAMIYVFEIFFSQNLDLF